MKMKEHTQTLLYWDFEYAFKFKKVEKNFDKLWGMKSSARESLKDWLLVSNVPPSSAEVCANACSEMIENCIKYTRNEAVAMVVIHVCNSVITVETMNAAEPEHHACLAKAIDALHSSADPKQIFIEKLLNPVDGKSHLGLIKIIMETRGKLNLIPGTDASLVHVRLEMKTLYERPAIKS